MERADSIETINQRESLIQVKVGNDSIFGVIHEPIFADSKKLVIYCGGINAQRCDVNRIAVKFSREMAAKGVSVLRFDYRGLGVSEVCSWDMTIDTKIEDITAVLDYALATQRFDEIFLLGFSDGARNIVPIALDRPEVMGLIMWNPTLVYNKVKAGSNKPVLDKKTKKILWVLNGIFLSSEFYRNVQKVEEHMGICWSEIKKPVCIIWGGDDITTRDTKRLMFENKTFADVTEIIVPGAKHLFCRQREHEQLISTTQNWLKLF